MFSESYFQKYKYFPIQIEEQPNSELKICVIIPCYNEPEILLTLNSLKQNLTTKFAIEIIILINSSETTPQNIIEINNNSFLEINKWIIDNSFENRKFFVKKIENLPSKFAGAGLARKIVMDEALRRFNLINNKNGFIVSLDADTICENNYLLEIEKQIIKHPKTKGFTIDFEHQKNPKLYSEENIKAIILYEKYLRYYIESLRFAKFPYAYQTIGSAFGVRADIYAMQGGMNTKQAGEDFYFLHKIIPLDDFFEINTTKVYPSSRISDRVPFGTGVVINKILNENTFVFETYNFDAFVDLKIFLEQIHLFSKFYDNKNIDIPEILNLFLIKNDFSNALISINSNCTNIENFKKRFYQWFDAFRIIKFLNFAHETYYKKSDILIEIQKKEQF